MGFINLPANLYETFNSLNQRLLKLENSARFTVPVVATDPVNRRNGDMWFNSTSNTLKVVDTVGNIRTVTIV